MTRPRSYAAAVLLALAGLLVLPGLGGTASATTTADVAQSLLQDPVYLDPKATAAVDRQALETAIGSASRPIYVAVLPSAAASANGGPEGVTKAIGQRLGDSAILFTVSGSTLAGGAGSKSGLDAGEAASIASATSGALTDRLVTSIRNAATAAADGPSGTDQTGGFTTGDGDSGSGHGGAIALGTIAVLGAGGGGLLYARSRRRRLTELEGSRADVESLYNRLGADVSNLAAGDDAVAKQALADAAERYNATGALLADADTPGEFAAARRTAVEGLTAARLARTRLGLDPGPEVPPPPGSGPQLQAEQQVRVGEQTYDGSPTYAPGRSHYWGGGYVGGQLVPGGWYGVPFWETLLLGSVLGGGFGGGYGGGYGGGGYDAGYDRGYDAGRDAGGHDGGGGSGGGDWGGGWSTGGGSGDWGGGGGGGGDWGGGGGGGGGDSGGGGGW